MFESLFLSLLALTDCIGWSFIYRLIFSRLTGRPRTRNADDLFSASRSCCFLIIACISFGWMFLLMPQFLIRSLYCFGLALSQSLIYSKRVAVFSNVALSPCCSLMNFITFSRVLFSYSLVISGLWASQSSSVYHLASFCLPFRGNIASDCGWAGSMFDGVEKAIDESMSRIREIPEAL
jgi:hypothetical protein